MSLFSHSLYNVSCRYWRFIHTRKELIHLIEINGVSKTFASDNGLTKAIDHISLNISQNEIFGIIGESGADS